MDCPNCGKAHPEGTEECTGCSLVFSKWNARAAAAQGPVSAVPKKGDLSAPGLPLILFVAALCAFGAWRAFSTKAESGTGAGPLDPTPYRTIILDLEKVLYKEEAVTTAVADRLENRARQLAGTIGLSARGELGRQAASWVESFASAVAGESQSQSFTAATRHEWIRRWEQLRSEAFLQAGWFHEPVALDKSAALLEESQAGQKLNDIRAALFGLAEDALAEARPFYEGGADGWRAWAKDWRPRIERVEADLPSDKSIPPGLWDAQQALRSAAEELKDLNEASAVPASVSRAKVWLEKARTGLERAASGASPG